MSLFEFVTVIIAMIFALAMGRLLKTVSALVKHRRKVVPYLPHMVWLACLLFFILNNWWSLWDFRDLGWTYPAFFYVLIAPILIFFAIELLAPEDLGDGGRGLREHFRNVRPQFVIDADWASLVAGLGVLAVMVFVAGLRFLPGRIA